MASGMSKANARQGKANEGRYKAYANEARRERNAVRRLDRHLKEVNKLRQRRGELPLTVDQMPGDYRKAYERRSRAARGLK